MTDIESRPATTVALDTDPLASAWARYLASIAMMAAATIVAIAVDSKVHIPNLSLVFVILCSRRWRSRIQFLSHGAALLAGRRRSVEHLGDRAAVRRRSHRERRCLHLTTEGGGCGTAESAGDHCPTIQPGRRSGG